MAYHVFYGKAPEPERLRVYLQARLDKKEIKIFIAETTDKNFAGFANIYTSFSSLSLTPLWILNDLLVLPKWRKHGIAGKLLDYAETQAAAAGASSLMLETHPDNKTAQSLYEKHGWKQSEYVAYYRAVPNSAR